MAASKPTRKNQDEPTAKRRAEGGQAKKPADPPAADRPSRAADKPSAAARKRATPPARHNRPPSAPRAERAPGPVRRESSLEKPRARTESRETGRRGDRKTSNAGPGDRKNLAAGRRAAGRPLARARRPVTDETDRPASRAVTDGGAVAGHAAAGRPAAGRDASTAGRDASAAGRPGTRSPRLAAAPPKVAKPKIVPEASSFQAYQELERTLYAVRDAVDSSASFEQFLEQLERRREPETRVRQITELQIGGDLHLHSTASDGKIPARKLPWLAHVMNLSTIAITDHDSVDGCREAFREAMLLGVRVIPGVELSTEQPGLEILAYFPDAGKFFCFMASSRSAKFRQALARRQELIHQKSLDCLEHVNAFLRSQKLPEDLLITIEEYDRWFGGQKPYFPGTLCVLGLARLSDEQRQKLKIHDPRAFNTRVVTPFLRDYDLRHQNARRAPGAAKQPKSLLAENFAILKTVAEEGVPLATFLAHPKELVTKGELSLGAVRTLVRKLANNYSLDGLEVSCSRDNEEDVRYWADLVAQHNLEEAAKPAAKQGKPLLAASHSSDFHVLGPGQKTGEITLGFGILDSRPAYRRGNLRPQMAIAEFLEQLGRRAYENVRRYTKNSD